MTNRRGVIFRILADLFVACLVTLSLIAASHSGSGAWFVGAVSVLLLAAGVAGYLLSSVFFIIGLKNGELSGLLEPFMTVTATNLPSGEIFMPSGVWPTV